MTLDTAIIIAGTAARNARTANIGANSMRASAISNIKDWTRSGSGSIGPGATATPGRIAAATGTATTGIAIATTVAAARRAPGRAFAAGVILSPVFGTKNLSDSVV